MYITNAYSFNMSNFTEFLCLLILVSKIQSSLMGICTNTANVIPIIMKVVTSDQEFSFITSKNNFSEVLNNQK